jgi:hypothetical protein
VIEQIASDASYSGPPDATGFSGGLVTFNAFKKPIVLTADTSYWLVLTPADPTTVVYWDHPNTGMPGAPFDVTHDPNAASGWYPRSAVPSVGSVGQMEIDGVAKTPEPSTLLLLGIGALGLTMMSRRA